MRRSAAPSQAGNFRPKFTAPLKQQNTTVQENHTQNNLLKRLFSNRSEQIEKSVENNDPKEFVNDKKEDLPVKTNVPSEPAAKKPKFESPLMKKPASNTLPKPINTGLNDVEKKDEVQVKYFSVVWCKRSSKKHKKWEGDASPPCSTDKVFHYSWDYAQQVHYPHHAQQVGPIYFKTPRKVNIFGMCSEGSGKQTFYLTDEANDHGKGANSVTSMVHHYFGNYGHGEKVAHIHFDNCSGQNKNNIVLWYGLWRVICAVLVTRGRSVTLYDTEGKEIGKGSGYKSTELASLKEDETLPIGGKEIQVMSILTEDQYKSGKCFTSCSVEVSQAPRNLFSKASNPASKQFSKPKKSGEVCESVGIVDPDKMAHVKPRHDPEAPDALVLTKPSQTHQWMWNKKNLPVIDVVVDPYLSYHLRPHQREGVTFLYECVMGLRNFGGSGAILADDMGLGKTLQCICLIWTLLKQGPYGGKNIAKRVLIVTPGSLVKNWFQEFKKWLGVERLKVYAVSADKKVEDFLTTNIYPVLIISYEMFVRVYETIKTVKFDLIVCDEGHRLKNTNIKTTSLLMSLPTQKRVVLTGTPIQNDLQEFYSIVEFCNPGVLGTSASFRRVYEDPIVAARQPSATPEEISLGEDRGAELSRMTQMFVLRRTQEINNKYLPPKNEIVVFCKPTPLQLSLYQQLLRCQLIRTCLTGNASGAPHLICIGALKKICNHPSLVYKTSQRDELEEDKKNKWDSSSLYTGLQSYFPDDYCIDEDLETNSGKLFVLSQLLQHLRAVSLKEKIVVVSNHTKTLDLIQLMCDSHGYGYLRLDGQTPTARRQELVQKFNGNYCHEFIFLLSSKAGGVGLNLIGASRLVLYDIDWNPANDLQAMARVWRDGQKRKVHIYRFLTTGSIEEKIFQRQISKQGLSGAVMDIREKNDVQFSLDDLKDLFSINIQTDCDTHDLLDCDCAGTRQENLVPVQKTVNRSCQLGVPKHSKSSKNIGMDELMEWKHYPGTIVNEHKDWYLESARDKISFIFYSDVHGGS